MLNTKYCRHFVAAFVFVCIVTALAHSAGETPSYVPADAVVLANSVLEEKWKRGASLSPEFYRIPAGVDILTAALAEPFVILELRGKALTKYLGSTNDDPRSFAALEKYCFPILVPDGTNVGTVVVGRNKDENSKKLAPDEGDFVWIGYLFPEDPVLADVQRMRGDYADGSEVYLVRFVDGGISERFFVADHLGRLFSGPDRKSMKPVTIDARAARDSIRAYRKTLHFPEVDE